jgi:uncharacterized protein (TIGR03083 family)
MTADPTRLVAALRDAHDRLMSSSMGLGQTELEQMSYCDDWTIAQVLSHLGSAAEIGRHNLLSALGEGPVLERPGQEEIWARWNKKTPEEQAAGVGASQDALLELLEGLEQERLEALEIPLGPSMKLGSSDTLRLWLGEWSLHSWDVSVVFDPSVRLRPDHVDLILDGLGLLTPWFAKPAGYDGPAKVAVHTLEPERYFLLSTSETPQLQTLSEPADTGATAELPAEAFVRLFYGRLDDEHLPSDIALEGVSLDQLRRLFPGS